MLRALHECIADRLLPWDSPVLLQLLRLRILGGNAVTMIEKGDFSLPTPDPSLLTSFFSLLAAMIAQDKNMVAGDVRPVVPVVAGLLPWAKKNIICVDVLLYYALELASIGNLARLCSLLTGLYTSVPDAVTNAHFTLPLLSALVRCSQRLVHDHLAQALMIGFYVPAAATHPHMLDHALRLLATAHSVIQPFVLGLACRQLCAAQTSNGGADDALFRLLAEHVLDSPTKNMLLKRVVVPLP